MNNEYLKLVYEALSKKIKLTESNSKALRKLYEEVAEELIKQAEKSKGFNKAWLNDYSKVVKNRLKELENNMYFLNKEAIDASSYIAAAIQSNFFQHIGEKFKLDIPKDILRAIYTVPEDVVLKLLSGGLYKDGKGLNERIWSLINKMDKDINYILAKGIVGNKPYLDIIKDLEKYVEPNAKKPWDWRIVYPGVNKQVDYNAQRLLRTALNHAFYLSSMESNKRNPYVESIHWELSSQHYERQVKRFGRDECDDYTEQNRYALGQGNFPKDEVPIPHPQCLCTQYGVVSKSMEDIGKELGDWLAGGSNKMLDEWYASIV
ncbi:hypothetical protein CPJCM30710_25560 [Clostridium polyendosporum]|uniref:Phage Mu protein F like protein n=1 Tax=Clostridium polyendosporum TaxID=69208 RepID=A0A919S285_9CLOT|nr:hypothetical protein [Clostridium polyendosporum]GIM29890.1 hypothetical protein CPJCM30710_25560 [Clostridium polyendosporum]